MSRTLRRAAALCCLGVVLIGLEYWYLHGKQQERTAAWADEVVAAKMEAARAHMARDHWDDAIRVLNEALVLDSATTLDQARALLQRAREGQAAAILQSAESAVAHKDAPAALRLLRDYLEHPQATERDRATRLREEIEEATSDREAIRLLASLSDADLARFAQRGQVSSPDGIHSDGVREIFKDTLRRHLAKEQQKREAKREAERLAAERRAAERARQVARLRNTPAFRSLSAFATQTLAHHREKEQLARRQEMALAQLFRQLNVNDPAEQAKIRARLRGRDDDRAAVVEAVDRKRAEVKRAYRDSPEFKDADRELFDQIVDEELDDLLKLVAAHGPRAG